MNDRYTNSIRTTTAKGWSYIQELSIIQLKSFPNMVSLVVWDHNTEHQALNCFLQISPASSVTCCLRPVHINIYVLWRRNRWRTGLPWKQRLWLHFWSHKLLSSWKGDRIRIRKGTVCASPYNVNLPAENIHKHGNYPCTIIPYRVVVNK